MKLELANRNDAVVELKAIAIVFTNEEFEPFNVVANVVEIVVIVLNTELFKLAIAVPVLGVVKFRVLQLNREF